MSEGISGRNAQILEDEGSELAMNDSDTFALLSDTFSGLIKNGEGDTRARATHLEAMGEHQGKLNADFEAKSHLSTIPNTS